MVPLTLPGYRSENLAVATFFSSSFPVHSKEWFVRCSGNLVPAPVNFQGDQVERSLGSAMGGPPACSFCN